MHSHLNACYCHTGHQVVRLPSIDMHNFCLMLILVQGQVKGSPSLWALAFTQVANLWSRAYHMTSDTNQKSFADGHKGIGRCHLKGKDFHWYGSPLLVVKVCNTHLQMHKFPHLHDQQGNIDVARSKQK